MPTLKQRKYSKSTTPARGSSNGADVARAQPDPPQQRRQPPQRPAPQASRLAGDDGQALEQQGVIDAMVDLQNHGADLGLPPGGPLQVEPWPPLLGARPPSVQQPLPPPPPPPPPQQQRQQPSRETLLLSIARMERCSRCHLRTWSFVQDPVTGALRTNALTIPNEVYNGRCLLCFPLPNGFAGAAAASSSIISNDDNGSDQGGRSSRAAGGTIDTEGPGAATETVAAKPAAAASLPSDSMRIDEPDISLHQGSGIAEEEQLPAEEEPEDDAQLDGSSRQHIEIDDSSGKSPYGAAEEDRSTTPTADEPVDDGMQQTNAVGRKRKSDSPQLKSQADDENDRGIKRCSLRSRSPKPPSAANKRTQSPTKRRKKKSASNKGVDVEASIRATIKELSTENRKAAPQIRCLKRLLSQIRRGKEEEVVSRIVKLRGVECLLALMRKSESSEVLALTCEIFLLVFYYNKQVTVALRVHEVIKDTLSRHPTEISLVTVLIGALRYATDNNAAIDREIIYDGCLDLVVNTAMNHRSSPRIQLNTMLFLQDLTSELTDKSDIKRVLQSGALAYAIQAVKRNWKSDSIVLASLAVVTNIFQNEVNAFHKEVATAEEGLRPILLRSIMKKARSSDIVAMSLGCLSNMSMERGGVNKIIAESGLLIRSMEMMDHFDDSAEVQRSGCLFLASFSRKGKVRANQIVKAGGIEAIVRCLDTYSDDAEVLAAALGALRNINHPPNSSCGVSEVIDHILKALENHNDDDEIQDYGCQLLLQYIEFPLVVNKLKTKRIRALLTRAAKKYPDSCRENVDRINAKLVPR